MQACFSAGCFWGIQKFFDKQPGVISSQVGYTGGITPEPNYEAVCSGKTQHAEAILIEFDENQLSYNQLLTLFWQCHNPCSLNAQGPDVGSQYRSGIFCLNREQNILAEQSKNQHQSFYTYPIVTTIEMLDTFYPAEAYHQHYLAKS